MKLTSITLPYDEDYTLNDLLEAGLQDFIDKIEEVSAV